MIDAMTFFSHSDNFLKLLYILANHRIHLYLHLRLILGKLHPDYVSNVCKQLEIVQY
jgi:hypothetical protein